MATRRTHNKTRLGCGQCKKRRIKCDGRHPRCINCEKKGVECSFILLAPSSLLTKTSSSPTSASPVSIASSSSPTSTELAVVPKQPYQVRVFRHSPRSSRSPCPPSPSPPILASIELNLTTPPSIPPAIRLGDVWKDCREWIAPHLQPVLAHYEYTTSLTPGINDPAKATWRNVIPELASTHRYLAHCVLAVASLHIGRLHEEIPMKNAMIATAATQMNKALSQYRPALDNLSPENATALFASATLTAVYFLRTSVIDLEGLCANVPVGTTMPSQDIVNKMLQAVLKAIWGLRGPAAVMRPGTPHDWVTHGKMRDIAGRGWWPTLRVPATERAVQEDARLCSIESLWARPGRAYESHFDVLAQALLDLRDTFALVSQLTLPSSNYPAMTQVQYSVDDRTVGYLKDRGAIFVWATRISREFMQLLEMKNREALVIAAHFAILPGRIRNVWWLESLGAHMVIAVSMALGHENWHLVEWPAQVVGVDLENAFGSRWDRLEGTPDELRMDVI